MQHLTPFLLLLALGSPGFGGVRLPRDECEQIGEQYDECVKNAQAAHTEALEAGDDGKPDFYSRKACNYLEVAVEVCGDMLVSNCYDEDRVREIKDQQYSSIVQHLEQSEEWESEKCPSIKEYKDRLAAAADEGEDAEEGEGVDEGEASEDEEGGEEAEAGDEEAEDGGEGDEAAGGEDEGEAEEEEGSNAPIFYSSLLLTGLLALLTCL